METEKNCKNNMIDCLLKDETIHTNYKNSYKLLKKTKPKKLKYLCKQSKICNICPTIAKGIPNSIELSKYNKKEIINNNIDKKTLEKLPECPYSLCENCEGETKYRLYDTAFNNNLINKYKK